jgi:hypothetical protein
MPLWGNVDNAANSDIAVLSQVKRSISTAERTALFGNTVADVYIANATVGQFGVDNNEMAAMEGSAKPAHAGWSLRTEGSGGRAGRVFYETLVAMGSLSGDASDDTTVPDYKLRITTQPTSNTWASGNSVTLRVVAASTPSGATLAYQWYKSYAGVPAMTQIAGATNSTLVIADNSVANGNTYRVVVSTTGAASVTSANATVTAT